jgi:nucleoside-diphosphate-sugar epimerase
VARGQVARTYIVAEAEDGLVLVDQHAAHERLVLERMRRAMSDGGVASQALLLPEVVELDEPACDRLEARAAELAEFGLELERFGPRAMLVRATPAMLGGGDVHENGLRVVRRVLRGGGWFAPSGQITAANVDDVAEAHLAALTRGEPGRAYILGGFAGPWRALFARIAAVTGGGPPRVTAPQPAMWLIGAVMELLAARSGAEPAMSRAQSVVVSANRAYSSAAATAALGYAPQPIEQGVAQCLAWARQTGRL